MFLKWLPWKFILRRLARRHEFLDPVDLLARLEQFSQPSEVFTPMELLRAGVIFHARGLVNARVIQTNMDWAWPYWVRRQFDPDDEAFLPRAFSITHVNLTTRNWTAVGVPDCPTMPVVDPRGLLTPLFDGWSIDAWFCDEQGQVHPASAAAAADQQLQVDGEDLAVTTRLRAGPAELAGRAWVQAEQGQTPRGRLRWEVSSDTGGWAALAIRPFNAEGVSFVHQIALKEGRTAWAVNGKDCLALGEPPDRHAVSEYRHGDVAASLADADDRRSVSCKVGLATAAACYRVSPGQARPLEVSVDLGADERWPARRIAQPVGWPAAEDGACRVKVPDERYGFLHRAALRTMILLSPADVYPGPYTYKRFWFRDAVYLLNAMITAGLVHRAERAMAGFLPRQKHNGYFLSQTGEWDSNGQVLWLADRYELCTGRSLPESWDKPLRRGTRWLAEKRHKGEKGDPLHEGLLPAGFSAEHLGNNDFYYWDDYWALGGLEAMGRWFDRHGDPPAARAAREEADDMRRAIERSLERSRDIRRRVALPASPYRRMDAGAVGSLAAGYPLEVLAGDDERLLGTAEFLLDHCRVRGAFFQDMIHSGINIYLTLHLAQVLLRAGDRRFAEPIEAVVALASPTGQWPEAIHPRTGGGCMGDGQHGWAAAEWLMMVHSMFLACCGRGLHVGRGLPADWLTDGGHLAYGPARTPLGTVQVDMHVGRDRTRVTWQLSGHARPERVTVNLPGHESASAEASAGELTVRRHSSGPAEAGEEA